MPRQKQLGRTTVTVSLRNLDLLTVMEFVRRTYRIEQCMSGGFALGVFLRSLTAALRETDYRYYTQIAPEATILQRLETLRTPPKFVMPPLTDADVQRIQKLIAAEDAANA